VKICEVDEFAKLAKFAFSVNGLERGRRPRRGGVADSRNHHPLTTALLNTTPPPNPSSTPPCTATTLVTSAGDVRDNGSGPFSSEAAGMAAYRASGVAAARVWNCLPPQSCLSVELTHGLGWVEIFSFWWVWLGPS